MRLLRTHCFRLLFSSPTIPLFRFSFFPSQTNARAANIFWLATQDAVKVFPSSFRYQDYHYINGYAFRFQICIFLLFFKFFSSFLFTYSLRFATPFPSNNLDPTLTEGVNILFRIKMLIRLEHSWRWEKKKRRIIMFPVSIWNSTKSPNRLCSHQEKWAWKIEIGG